MNRAHPAGSAKFFGKPYTWRLDHDGTLTLHPAPQPAPSAESEQPFTADLVRAGMRQLAAR